MSYNLPYGMAEFNGVLYVADYANQAIYTANPLTPSITSGTFVNSLSIGVTRPNGLVIDSSGFMYVSDYANNKICRVEISDTSNFNALWTAGVPDPYSMAIDASNGYMYVSSVSTNNIFRLNFPSGGVQSSNVGTGFTLPNQIQLVGGNLYVADQNGVYYFPVNSGGSPGTQLVSLNNTGHSVGLVILNNYLYVTVMGSSINVYNFPSGSLVSAGWKNGLLEVDYLYTNTHVIFIAEDNNVAKYNPYGICFLKGSKILCQENGTEVYRKIEEIKIGTLVKTILNGYIPVEIIKISTIYNSGDDTRTKERLYLLSKSIYPELTDNLIITGGHSVLVDKLTDKQREDTITSVGTVFCTENKYRLLSYLDERAVPYPHKGTFEIYHICLQNTREQVNYGIYANGLLVESCCKRHI